MDVERPGCQAQPYLLQTSSEHVWEPVDLSFSYVVASPKLPSHSGVLPLHSEMCVCGASLFLSLCAGGRGFQPHPCKRRREVLGPGSWLWASATRPSEAVSVSVFSPRKTRACWRSAQGVLQGFHMLF